MVGAWKACFTDILQSFIQQCHSCKIKAFYSVARFWFSWQVSYFSVRIHSYPVVLTMKLDPSMTMSHKMSCSQFRTKVMSPFWFVDLQ